MKTLIRTALAALLLGGTGMAFAEANSDDAAAGNSIRAAIKAVNPQLKVDSVAKTPLPGIYEVVIGGQVAYVSADGHYLVQGNIINLKSGESISEARRAELRLEKIAALGEDKMLIYEPTAERTSQITVYTDIDCPYCRKMHADIDQFLAAGVRVRYLLMPRAGIGSDSYKKAVNAWCADDPQTALTEAKQGKPLPKKDCEHPVVEHLELARKLGVNATPTIVLEDGSIEAGYRNASYLFGVLGVQPPGRDKAKLGPRN